MAKARWYVGATENPSCEFEVRQTVRPIRESWVYAYGPYSKAAAKRFAREQARRYDAAACLIERGKRTLLRPVAASSLIEHRMRRS